VKDYFGLLGAIALAIALTRGTWKRQGSHELEFALGLFAIAAWRAFLAIAAGLAVLFVICAIAVYFGWIHW
jgi:hypothetical protein